jgi:flavin-dependent dehydrogenase
MRVDVAVLGSGPAGAVAALVLARPGASVLLLDRGREPPAVGETILPAGAEIITALGLWNTFLQEEHLPVSANRSLWGDDDLHEYDFIRSPRGPAWHLDVLRFRQLLRAAAVEAGARSFHVRRLISCTRLSPSEWSIAAQSDAAHRSTIRCTTVIDATGRSRWLLRSHGIRTQSYDHLLAAVCVLPAHAAPHGAGARTVVEAVEHGWWAINPLPNGCVAAVFLTDADIMRSLDMRSSTGWRMALGRTTHIRSLVAGMDDSRTSAVRLVDASTAVAPEVAGTGWYAVGDAAAAVDPLSSLGITMAMESGCRAAQDLLQGRAAARGYASWLEERWAGYLAAWLGYYAAEQRWSTASFWARRHAAFQQLHSGIAAR